MKQLPITCLAERVLLKRIDAAQISPGGIQMVSNSKSIEAIVISVGPGVYDTDSPNFRQPMPIKPGDHVVFGQYAGFEWSYLGETYIVCREADVCLIVHDGAKTDR